MAEKHKGLFEKISNKDLVNKLSATNPELSQFISSWKDTQYAYLARYPYGKPIFRDGIVYLPNEQGKIVPISDDTIPSEIREDLSYGPVPIGIFTHNKAEVFFEMEERVISLNLFEPGYIMGLWECLDKDTSYLPKRIWQVSSGARSLLMLPKITDAGNHKILERTFDLEHSVPRTLMQHWYEFKKIANHPTFNQIWYSEIVFLPKAFFEKIRLHEPKYYEYQNHLKDLCWAQSGYWRNKITYDIIWEIHFAELNRYNEKPNPYDIHIAKHIALLGMGILPSLIPATNDECAPISGLQDVYTQLYKQKRYIPTIMTPGRLSKEKPEIKGYYSLRFPTLLEAVPKTRNHPSVLHDLRHIKRVVEKFQKAALNGKLPIEKTPFFEFVKNIEISYFHSEIDEYYNIKSSKTMPTENKNLIYYKNKLDNMVFSTNSAFVRGCVQLAFRENAPKD